MEYKIHESKIEILTAKLKTIQKKCVKNGCDFEFEIGEPFFETTKELFKEVTRKYYTCKVSGVASVGGYEFLAKLEHLKGGNIISKFNQEFTIPEKYKTISGICEHCNQKRYRKETFLLRNIKDNSIKQVGKTCLALFLDGINAEFIASYLQALNFNFAEYATADDDDEHAKADNYFTVFEILKLAVAVVKKSGFISKQKAAETGAERTSNIVQENIDNNKKYDVNAIEIINEAKKVFDYICSLKNDYDYNNNLLVITNKNIDEMISRQHISILVSAVAMYHKYIAKLEKEAQKLDAINNNFFGNVGDKVTFDSIELKNIANYETAYGFTHIYEIIANNQIFIWHTQNEFENGTHILKTATIKEHKNYNGINQTILTRCKIL
ncbi:MAG: hypothetical protein RR054_04390 [Clostridia bacterium]